MPRNMSFSKTLDQFLDGTKTVTRRLGWTFLRPGEVVYAVEKSMGLKRGQRVRRLGKIRIVSVRREPLGEINQDDVIKEGFPKLDPKQFIRMFCSHFGCSEETIVTRIEFMTEWTICDAAKDLCEK